MCGMSLTSRPWLLFFSVSLGPKAAGRGFLARMLPCEKSVGGISTRRTLSLQPWWPGGKPQPVNTQVFPAKGSPYPPPSAPPLRFLASSFDEADEAPGQNDSSRGARAIIRAVWVPEDDHHPRPSSRSTVWCERARTNERTNEQTVDATRLSRVGCSPASNMWIYFIQPFPSGTGLNYFRGGVVAADTRSPRRDCLVEASDFMPSDSPLVCNVILIWL
jgi:hypothetical protein